jgi:hypothetical protein
MMSAPSLAALPDALFLCVFQSEARKAFTLLSAKVMGKRLSMELKRA